MQEKSKLVGQWPRASTHLGCVSALAWLLAGCGGGGGGAGAIASTSSSTATTLFEQPQETGIAGNLVVPLADNTKAPAGTFVLIAEQINPSTTNGELVPTAWDAGAETGFAPSDPGSDQLGYQNVAGTSTAQMDADTVGAYINSKDVPTSPVDPGGSAAGCGHTTTPAVQKMMIAPQYTWVSGTAPAPFASATAVLNGELDLQVPTASGDAYVVADLLFEDANGLRVSYGVKLFANGVKTPTVGCGYDAPSKSFTLDSPLGVDQRFVTMASGSMGDTGVTWHGSQHFEWSITQSQFTAALQFLSNEFPGQISDLDPTLYSLVQVHLNAEINFLSAPAELGWSMSNLQLWVVD